MKDAVVEYALANKELNRYFKCDEDYPFRILTEKKWSVQENEGLFFLTYWPINNSDSKLRFAIAKKDGEPLVYKSNEYSMIVAIDCIKIAFVFKNKDISGRFK